MRKIFIAIIAIVFLALTYESLLSFSTGIGGRTRKNSYGEPEFGCSCHNVDSLSSVKVRIYGPTVVAPGFTYVYRVSLKGGPAIGGGFDFNAWYGTVDTVAGQNTVNFGFDITHSFPQAFVGQDSISWLVKYTAKDTNTILYDTLYATGNSVNFNHEADSLDRWCFAPNFVVKIDPATIGIQNGGVVASKFTLEQNYPNPFNPSTTIRFSLKQEAFVTLKIFDIAGREVEMLVNGNRKSGEHEISWSASSYPSGIYFYRMTADGQNDEKKMVLIK